MGGCNKCNLFEQNLCIFIPFAVWEWMLLEGKIFEVKILGNYFWEFFYVTIRFFNLAACSINGNLKYNSLDMYNFTFRCITFFSIASGCIFKCLLLVNSSLVIMPILFIKINGLLKFKIANLINDHLLPLHASEFLYISKCLVTWSSDLE